MTHATAAVIDDRCTGDRRTALGTRWELLTDTVMGGVSAGRLTAVEIDGRAALLLEGEVRLDNNGGFIQMAFDLEPDGGPVDAAGWTGLELDVHGNDQVYAVHLRTMAVSRPWQSYRQSFVARPTWQTLQLPFDSFEPHRLETPFDPASLRRIGLVAIGRAFQAALALGGLRFY